MARTLIIALFALGAAGCAAPTATAGGPQPAAPPPAAAQGPLDDEPPGGEDKARLRLAIEQMDAGQFGESIAALEALRLRHPNNAIVLHELGLAYRLAKRPREAIALWMPYRDRLSVDTLAGLASALDESGQTAEALTFLREEITRHPTSGLLHSELGTTLLGAGKQDEALRAYERGVEVEPSFGASYLHLAEIHANGRSKGLSLLYGETFRLIEPMTERSKRIGILMVQVCNDSVQLEASGRDVKARVSLAPDLVVRAPSPGVIDLPLANAFELTFGPGLVNAHIQGLNLATLHGARRAFLDALKKGAPPALGSLPLTRWLLALDAAGHLEAYDYWLYGPADPATQARWFEAHQGAVGAMAQYLASHPLFPRPRREREKALPTAAIPGEPRLAVRALDAR